MPQPERHIRFELDRKINIQTVVATTLILIAVITSYVRTQDKVDGIQEQHRAYSAFQVSIEEKIETRYVSKEQLDYIVVQRIDRLEQTLERRIRELEAKLEIQLNRIEDKLE